MDRPRPRPQPREYPGYICLSPIHPLAMQLIAWRAAAECCEVNPAEHVFFSAGRAYISRKLYGLSYIKES